MAYGLPTRGQHDYDDELNNSVEAVYSTAQDAKAQADSARSDAAYAKNLVDSIGLADITSAVDTAESAATDASSSATSASGAASSAQSYATVASNERVAAEAARDAAEAAQAAAEAVPTTSDTIIAGRVNDSTSATSAALSATFVAAKNPPKVQGSKNGIQYDGTDESAAMQALINACSTYGVGVIELEGIVRCDTQLTIPTSGATQLRQAPLRITGSVQYMPGSTFTEANPFPKAAGLDLRYAGRIDTGCTTTVGSVVVANTSATAADRGNIVSGPGIPDWCWILSSEAGVGWTLSKPARATGTATLKNYGGRIQTIGYGTLEVDHLQLLNLGTASSAPFLLTTATKVDVHHNLVLGHNSKTGGTCDEDIVLGGPGQGTRLTSALTASSNYTSLSVAAVPVALPSGASIVIGEGTTNAQTVTTSASVAVGATSIPVTSFTAAANHPVSDSVYFRDSQAATGSTAYSVAAGLFQGYGSRVHDNQFFRFRRVVLGGFASSVHIDHNAWMHNCGSTNSVVPATLTTALTSGATTTALAVTATPRAILSGDTIQVGSGSTSQEFTASADTAVGATSIPVTSVAANADYAIGVKVVNTTAGTGAAIESHAVGTSANSLKVDGNRIGFSGGYNYATRFTGSTVGATIIGNDLQDMQATTAVMAGYRFGRGAQYNLVVAALASGSAVPTVDDWSAANHTFSQTVLEPGQARPSRFPQGIQLESAITIKDPSVTTFVVYDSTGDSLMQWTGTSKELQMKKLLRLLDSSGNALLRFSGAGNKALWSTAVQITGLTGQPALLEINAPTGQAAQVQFQRNGTNSWLVYDANSTSLYFRDSINAKMHMTFTPGAGAGGGTTEFNTAVKIVGNVGFYNTTPIAKQTLAAAATDATTTQALANDLRTKLIALGLFS